MDHQPVAGHQLALALDATTLGTRFTVLAISVVYRGCAIPVAWTILPANQPRAWRREWLRRLRTWRPAIPRDWTVIVWADRRLYAGWLFRRIVRLGWHPFLRINAGGTFRPTGHGHFSPLTTFVPHVGSGWRGTGTAFKSTPQPLPCTLLACWEQGYTAPWLILTDLPPEADDAGWYGLRAWIEQGFKVTKRAGWQWQRTRMTEPQRAARLWLAVAVATLWLLSVGGMADAAIPDSTLQNLLDRREHHLHVPIIASGPRRIASAGGSDRPPQSTVGGLCSPTNAGRRNASERPCKSPGTVGKEGEGGGASQRVADGGEGLLGAGTVVDASSSGVSWGCSCTAQ
jgi:hypothetical protein